MSSRRTLILVAALVVGALSAFLVFNYVSSADDRAAGAAKRVPVLVVKKDVPKGLGGRQAQEQGYIKRAEIASEFKPATSVNDPSVVENKVAVSDLAAGQVLVQGMFADPIESQITFAGRVPEQCGPASPATGQPEPCVAITMSFDTVKGVAGVIVPGDFVNILLAPNASEDLCAAGKPAPSGGVVICKPNRYLYQSVQVLFVGQTTEPQPGETAAAGAPAGGGLITFAVPPEAAQLLASVGSEGMYLTLLPPNYAPVPLPALNPYPSAFPAENQAQLTPYGPQGVQKK